MALSQLSSRLFLPNKETKPGEMGFAADVLSYGLWAKGVRNVRPQTPDSDTSCESVDEDW